MKSQWECFLQNLGVWEGSFTNFSPQGTLLNDTPSRLSLEGLNNNQTVRLTLCRSGRDDLVKEYSSLGRSLLFFENGSFSEGLIQLGPFSEFGGELAFVHENRRLRLVQLFDTTGQLKELILIREHLAGTPATERPTLQINDLLGEWQGQAVTIYPDWRSPHTYSTTLKLQLDDAGRLIQNTSFAERTITSTATIKGPIVLFDQDPEKQVQVLFLPDGASATSPLKVQLRQPFFIEAGWLIQPNLRQRMIRSYNDKGEWVSLTLVIEERKL
ncbi:hypothetical protein CDG76_23945 [Nostoc sp. 'Peltigera membranacea cyanobiont' 210A]|uniref:DUF3598 family protein n=1 Tax=Nostoc sp. 'Peltigera membranacea cyanobiont' 210A TaxID=2014529 RepID=UPI000B95525A|nr:DUF3598 family protein [Nostoc sp. 'Peltigera membranacea cyanobiont' 210A]OYD92570.1 hypothetical protein CDG76_23945 [Nostoc sp. 'Peltigera membranacea cyanobiont' 210A]